MKSLNNKINVVTDNSNDLLFQLSKQDLECWIVEEAQLVIDEYREIVQDLLVENRILKEDYIDDPEEGIFLTK